MGLSCLAALRRAPHIGPMRRAFPFALLALCTLPFALQAETAPRVPQSEGQIALSFAPVVKKAAPAVVNIYTKVLVQGQSPFAGDPFFEQFFGDLGPLGAGPARVENALGSGVILGAEGLVVSNYHVVDGAAEIRVVLSDRREFEAELLLGDKDSDLAVLRLKGAENLPVLPLRDSDTLEVGDLVLAIGNPFGVGQTVSSGIVSALERSGLAIGSGRGLFIQTDAAINPGNSGGALVDTEGRLVGINTAILSRGGGSNGIGFAIPANLVAQVLEQARAGATHFARPWAGVQGQAVDAALAEALGLPRPEGLLLSALHPESPFAKAGLAPGDVILALGDHPVTTPQEVIFRMSAAGPGAVLPLLYWHEGAQATAEVTLIPPPDSPPSEPLRLSGPGALAGLGLARVNPKIAAEFDLPVDLQGLAVTEAPPRAQRLGFRPGDVILALNGAALIRPDDLALLLESPPRRLAFDLWRAGRVLHLGLRL